MMFTSAPRAAAVVLCALVLLAASGAQAQVQRSFINSSFEEPVLPSDACWSIRESQLVPGWETTEPTWTGNWTPTEHGTCGGHKPSPPIEGAMQIFKGNFQGANPASGSQYAELNAYTPSRLYQTACLISGDVVQWQFAHKGRASNTERAAFNIGTNPSGAGSQLIVDVTTTTTGTGTINSVGTGSASVASNVNNWANYSGSFTWSGATGMQTVGFQALSGASVGNYLDEIHFDLTPFVEFATASGSDAEATGGNIPQIVVSGRFLAPTSITVNVVGGTATLGADYTTPSGSSSFQVMIPAGQYAGALFPLGVEIIDDDSQEDDETIVFELDATSSDYMVLSTQTCGAPALASSTYTILDDDIEVDLAITKDDGQTAYSPGGTVIYEIVVTNNGPVDVLGAQISDPLPNGITDASWACADDGGGSACSEASGTGAIATAADLPVGTSVTYTLTVPVPVSYSGDLTNTATVDVPVGMTDADPSNNTASDTNTQFTTPPGPVPGVCNIANNGSFESPDIQNDPEGPGDNTAFVNGFAVWRTTTNPISGWETVAGTIDILRLYNNASEGLQSIDMWGTAAATIRQTFTGLVPGGQYTFSVDYSGLSAANSIAVVQLGNGVGATPVTLATLQPSADGIFNGNAGVPDTPMWSVVWSTYTHTFTATGTEATIQIVNNTAPATQNTGLFVDNFIFAGDPCADLGVVKTVTPDAVVSGDEVVYTLQVANNGPDAADGAVVTDAGVPGSLECTALSCSAGGGAVCPGSPTPAQLAAGLAIPTFPVGGTLTLELTCTVTATGN